MRGKLRCRLLAQAATSAGDHPLIVLTAATQEAIGSTGRNSMGQSVSRSLSLRRNCGRLSIRRSSVPGVTPASPQHTTSEAQDDRSLRVLLAEDNAINQRLTVRLLEKRGHTVTVVQDGTEALAALRRQMFDVVLMDIQMPCMDGLETTQAIRRASRTPRRVSLLWR